MPNDVTHTDLRLELQKISSTLGNFIERSTTFREQISKDVEKISSRQEEHILTYGPMLKQLADERKDWKDISFNIKKNGIFALASFAGMAALIGFFTGVHSYWTKAVSSFFNTFK
jgi:hypothetical protein